MFNLINKWKQKKELKEEARLLPKRVEFYKNFIQPGDLVFDIGANTGNRIEPLLLLNAKVVAAEPQPECAESLLRNFGNRIFIEKMGLGSIPGHASMKIADVSTISSLSDEFIQKTGTTRFKRNKWTKEISIELTTLDLLIKKYGLPVFCKIDVEGYEAVVLKDLHYPIPVISFEYCVPEMRGSMIECIRIIETISKSCKFNYSIGESMNLACDEWVDADPFLDIVKSEDFDQTLFGDIYCKLR